MKILKEGKNRQLGLVIKWLDGKGYGFIQPAIGNVKVFFHISQLSHGLAKPKVGEIVSYVLVSEPEKLAPVAHAIQYVIDYPDKCNTCGKIFLTLEGYIDHLKVHARCPSIKPKQNRKILLHKESSSSERILSGSSVQGGAPGLGRRK